MGQIEAVFIGGPWDGKEYAIPGAMKEFRVALMKEPKVHWITKNSRPDESVYDIAVYRHVLNEIYWFHGIEKRG